MNYIHNWVHFHLFHYLACKDSNTDFFSPPLLSSNQHTHSQHSFRVVVKLPAVNWAFLKKRFSPFGSHQTDVWFANSHTSRTPEDNVTSRRQLYGSISSGPWLLNLKLCWTQPSRRLFAASDMFPILPTLNKCTFVQRGLVWYLDLAPVRKTGHRANQSQQQEVSFPEKTYDYL